MPYFNCCGLLVRSLLLGVFAWAGLGSATSLVDVAVDQPFRYKLYTADVACWQSGACQGQLQEGPRGALGQSLRDLVAMSEKNIDMALYGVRRQTWFLRQLKQLKEAGVELRALVDQDAHLPGGFNNKDNFPYPDVTKLMRVLGRSQIRADVDPDGSPRQSRLMHNKFMIVDERYLWVSTANVSDTETGAEYHANAALILDSPAAAKLYQAEFAQMFEGRRHGIHKTARIAPTRLNYQDGSKVSIGFSPQDAVIDTLIGPTIDGAKQDIFMSLFFLSDRRLWRKLVVAKRRGVRVRLILDATAARHPSSYYKDLLDEGIEVVVENLGGKMHMKCAVIDGDKTLIGSMNWSRNGDLNNDENTLLIEDNRQLASQMSAYMEELWESMGRGEILGEPPRAESLESINSCFDGIDNDHDGRVDADDYGCR